MCAHYSPRVATRIIGQAPEDGLRWTSLDPKIGPVLKRLGLPSLEDDPNGELEWDLATALRNQAVHGAAAPSMPDATDVVSVIGRIIDGCLEPILAEARDPTPDVVAQSLSAVREATGTYSDPRLVALIERILPRLSKRLVLHHKKFHP